MSARRASSFSQPLTWVGVSMLVGDRTKFFALIFGFAFATLLMAQQSAFCIGLVSLAGNAVQDVEAIDVWVMKEGTKTIDSALPMAERELQRVRGIDGVARAFPMFRGGASVRQSDGGAQAVTVIGVDESALVGLPSRAVIGAREEIRQPDAVFLNRQAFEKIFPGEPLSVGKTFELNDRRVVVRGVVETLPWFSGSNVLFTKYSSARNYAFSGRSALSFVLVQTVPGVPPGQVAERVSDALGLKALSSKDFSSQNITDLVENSGIVLGFGVVVALGALVGAVIVGLTLSLFIRDNIKALGTLKAIGARNHSLNLMVLSQSLLAALIGYATGIGATVLLIKLLAGNVNDFSTFYVPWQVLAGTAAAVLLMTLLATLLSLRPVNQLDAAEIFR